MINPYRLVVPYRRFIVISHIQRPVVPHFNLHIIPHLNPHVIPRLHDDVVVGVELDVALGFELDELLVSGVREDVVLLAVVVNADKAAVVHVVYLHGVAVARAEGLDVVAVTVPAVAGPLLAVIQGADHVGLLGVAVLETHHHLLVNLRDDVATLVVAAMRLRDAQPRGPHIVILHLLP